MIRYSKIKEKNPREILLLQGTGCAWRKCIFCDWYTDVSNDPFSVNLPIIDKITGEFAVIDVVNSGSAPAELDSKTFEYLKNKIYEKKIKTVWFETHWMYRNTLQNVKKIFPKITIKFRTGVDTFNGILRESWNKGIPKKISPKNVSEYFDAASLNICMLGQTFEDIKNDINLATKYFERVLINVFTPNSTAVLLDKNLLERFKQELYPTIAKNPKIEILLQSTDFEIGLLNSKI